MPDTLPEGTDRIVAGNAAGISGDTPSTSGAAASGTASADASAAASSATAQATAAADDLRARASGKAEELRAQAGDKAREYAMQGKERATGALDDMARLIGDNAGQIDDKLGAAYGDYARKAADAVSGFSGQLRDKDIDELLDDARELVRRSPALALGAAAAAGFLFARVVKSGSETLEAAAERAEPAPRTPTGGPAATPTR